MRWYDNFRSFFTQICLSIFTAILVYGCSNSDDFLGQPTEISDEDAVIVFSAASWPAVTFQHRDHSEYWNNNCFECHSHTDVRDETKWKCSECHSDDDSENLCTDDAEGHDCMFVQCFNCHQSLDADPTPECSTCHLIAASTGQFYDSPVSGLIYSTPALRGITDSQGTFQYSLGDTITFSIGDIILGSGVAKPIMTPVDLVPGATDELDQTVTNIARFLQSLDYDDDLSNGITIPNEILNVIADKVIDFSVSSTAFADSTDLQEILTTLDKALVEESDAQEHLRSTLLSLDSAPVASNVIISGSLVVDQTLSGVYTYFDADNDEEGISTYKWYLAEDALGTNKTEIFNETNPTYTLVGADTGKFIIFEVTPVASSGITTGAAQQSVAFGPISINPTNIVPVVSACEIEGPPNTYFILSASYSYYDIDGDQEGDSIYQWYIADDILGTNESAISGANDLTYHPQTEDSGKFLIFKVTPAALTGNSPGLTCVSTAVGPVTNDAFVSVFGAIATSEAVDTYRIRFNATTNVTIDVESNESSHYGWNNYRDLNMPTDLGFPEGGPTNGPGNDLLTSNIYLFTSDGTVIDFQDGNELCSSCGSCHFSGQDKYQPTTGFPGCSAPNAFTTRNPFNPYLDMAMLPAGEYLFVIGSQYLSETDALFGTNSEGSSGWADPGSGYFNNYKITFIFE